nr:MAG TPA: hypothetical protein [Bacteriophage sp.]
MLKAFGNIFYFIVFISPDKSSPGLLYSSTGL